MRGVGGYESGKGGGEGLDIFIEGKCYVRVTLGDGEVSVGGCGRLGGMRGGNILMRKIITTIPPGRELCDTSK